MTIQFFLNHSSIHANSMPPANPAAAISRVSRTSISAIVRSVCPPWCHPCGWRCATPTLAGTPYSATMTGTPGWRALSSRR